MHSVNLAPTNVIPVAKAANRTQVAPLVGGLARVATRHPVDLARVALAIPQAAAEDAPVAAVAAAAGMAAAAADLEPAAAEVAIPFQRPPTSFTARA